MNRMIPVLALIAFLFAGLFATLHAQADSTTDAKAKSCTQCLTGKTTKAKAAFHHTARKAVFCCMGGSCCPQCPTCCQASACNTGKCPKGCCNASACQQDAPCCN